MTKEAHEATSRAIRQGKEDYTSRVHLRDQMEEAELPVGKRNRLGAKKQRRRPQQGLKRNRY